MVRLLSARMTRSFSKKAVIFDFGGVVIPSLVPLVQKFALKNNLSKADMHELLFKNGDSSLWGELETGTINAAEFSVRLNGSAIKLFGKELKGDLMNSMLKDLQVCKPYPEVIIALEKLKTNGFKTALLTNNFYVGGNRDMDMPVDMNLFDVVRMLKLQSKSCCIFFFFFCMCSFDITKHFIKVRKT